MPTGVHTSGVPQSLTVSVMFGIEILLPHQVGLRLRANVRELDFTPFKDHAFHTGNGGSVVRGVDVPPSGTTSCVNRSWAGEMIGNSCAGAAAGRVVGAGALRRGAGIIESLLRVRVGTPAAAAGAIEKRNGRCNQSRTLLIRQVVKFFLVDEWQQIEYPPSRLVAVIVLAGIANP